MTTPLNELWDFLPSVGDSAGESVKVWIGRSSRFIAVASKVEVLADGTIQTPESQATLRVRWRPDVSQNSRWIDPNGRLWVTSGWEEIGRQQYLDVGIARFGYIESGPVGAFIPPDNWPLLNTVDNSAVETLEINHFIEASGSGWLIQDADDPVSQRVGFRVSIPPGGFTVEVPPGFVLEAIVDGALITWPVLLPGGSTSVMGIIHLGMAELIPQAQDRIGNIRAEDTFWPAGSREEPANVYDMLRLWTSEQATAFDTSIQGLAIGDTIRIQSAS